MFFFRFSISFPALFYIVCASTAERSFTAIILLHVIGFMILLTREKLYLAF